MEGPVLKVEDARAYIGFGRVVRIIVHMVSEMCTSCAHALDGVDDGKRCISLGTWHGYACVGSISPHVQVGTGEVASGIRCSHPWGEKRVDMFVCAVALHVRE